MPLVAVGSTNPVKINAVSSAFARVWPNQEWECKSIGVDSGVSSQPFSDTETITGAVNRAQNSLKSLKADFGVGLEGGVQEINNNWFDCGWVAVTDKQGVIGLGSTARIIVPPAMVEYLKQGEELGSVVDRFFNTQNAKQNQGHFGLMTNNAVTRTSGYADGVMMALARFINPQLF